MKTPTLKPKIFTLLSSLLVLTACKKDEIICNSYTELTDKNHLVDITPLNQASAFNDSLTKYPQLRVYKVINDQYTLGMHCNVFFKGLKVFINSFDLYLRKSTNKFIPYILI